jgi:hypothetical protein
MNIYIYIYIYIYSASVNCRSEVYVYKLITPTSCTVDPRDFIYSSINFNVNSIFSLPVLVILFTIARHIYKEFSFLVSGE